MEQNILQKAWRRLENAFPSLEEAKKRLIENKGLTVYLGIDPTGPEIHLGHTIPLLFLKNLYEFGHKPIIIIGNFTAKIGDPSGKDAMRKSLSDEQIADNEKTYLKQISKILPQDSFTVRHNGEWLSGLTFTDIIKLASHFTVQQTIARDMFQERLKKNKPIGLHEFLYPLMQGYDSVAMVKGGVDGEVGGNDQTFNMLVGRELEKKLLNKDKLVFATKLLVSPESGKKMSKSEGTLVAVNDKPEDVFGKTMATTPDRMIQSIFELCTDLDQSEIDGLAKEFDGKPMEFKKKLAFELTRMYHNNKAALAAQKSFEDIFSKGLLPQNIKEVQAAGINIIDLITEEGLAESRSEAKRLIDQKAVTANENFVDWDYIVKAGDVIKIGPRKFIKVT